MSLSLSIRDNARASPVSDAHQRRPVDVRSMQGFLHSPGRMRVKKLVQNTKKIRKNQRTRSIRLATWNIGTMTGKSSELADILKRRKVSIACLQETRWKGAKSRDIGEGYKLIYAGSSNRRNGIGIVLDRDWKDKVVEVIRKGDRLMMVKLVMDSEVLNVISAYAPQAGLDEGSKTEFWDSMDEVFQSIPQGERIILGGDLNGHVGKERGNYARVHGGHGFGTQNEEGKQILEFAVAYDLAITNSFFQKKEDQQLTFSSGSSKSQLDYFLTRRDELKDCRNCKVIPGESLSCQHRLVVLDMHIKSRVGHRSAKISRKIRWWKLQGDRKVQFRNRVMQKADWNWELSASDLWEQMARVIVQCAKEVVGETRGTILQQKETWWWCSEVQAAILQKKLAFKKWQRTKDRVDYEEYKKARREAKSIVSKAKFDKFDEFYRKLDTRDGEKDIFRLARARERRSRDIEHVRCIKDASGLVLTNEEGIQERWKRYFQELLNEEFPRDAVEGSSMCNVGMIKLVSAEEVLWAVSKMKCGKALGPDGIPVEVWKALGSTGSEWLVELFNKIIREGRMPEAWRHSFLIPVFKNKGDVQCCSNYRGIKLMSHTMKIWERVIERRLREETSISENQFGFMPGRSTMEPIFCVRQLMEKFREKRRDLHMVFIDLEKAYDRVPRELLWDVLQRKNVPWGYIQIVQDMYAGAVTRVRSVCGETENFAVNVGVHQGSALSPFLFLLVLDELTRGIQGETPWCMLFADDVVLVDETKEGLNARLEDWRRVLEGNGLRISRTKTEYVACHFGDGDRVSELDVQMGAEVIQQKSMFKYLGSVMQQDGEIDGDVTSRISCGWLKWRQASGVLCDRRIPLRLKGKFYRSVVRPAMLYGSECWAPKKGHEQSLHVAEMRMLRWMCGVTRKDRVKNEHIRGSLKVAPIGDKLKEGRLRWYGHVVRRGSKEAILRALQMVVDGKRGRGRPRRTWVEVINKDMKDCGVTSDLAQDRKEWRKKTQKADPK